MQDEKPGLGFWNGEEIVSCYQDRIVLRLIYQECATKQHQRATGKFFMKLLPLEGRIELGYLLGWVELGKNQAGPRQGSQVANFQCILQTIFKQFLGRWLE